MASSDNVMGIEFNTPIKYEKRYCLNLNPQIITLVINGHMSWDEFHQIGPQAFAWNST